MDIGDLIIILGPPGSGKGTQAEMLSEKMDYNHISTGEILRGEVANKTDIGQQASKYIERGSLVPDELIFDVIKNKLNSINPKNGFILDGFPRNIEQAEMLDDLNKKIDLVIYLNVPENILIDRVLGRRECVECGAIQDESLTEDGSCYVCGGKTVVRSDDDREIIKHRIEVYENETHPLKDYYDEKGLLVQVDGTGAPDEINNTIKDLITTRLYSRI